MGRNPTHHRAADPIPNDLRGAGRCQGRSASLRPVDAVVLTRSVLPRGASSMTREASAELASGLVITWAWTRKFRANHAIGQRAIGQTGGLRLRVLRSATGRCFAVASTGFLAPEGGALSANGKEFPCVSAQFWSPPPLRERP